MSKKHLGTMLVVLALVCTATACKSTTQAAEAPNAEQQGSVPAPALADRSGLSAQETAEAFFSWYVKAVRATFEGGQPVTDKVLQETGYLSPELVARIQADREAMRGAPGGADPILCAQDVPQSVQVTVDGLTDDHAALTLTSDLIGHRLGLEMERTADGWRIVEIHCLRGEPVAQAAPEAHDAPRQVIADYGFALSFPEGWTYQEIVKDPNKPPIGPEAVQAMLLIMPQAWADAMANRQGPPDPNAPVIAPFTLEVVLGGADGPHDVYPDSSKSEEIHLAGQPARREVEVITDDLSLTRYLVQHSKQPDLWLVFTDPISGFPDRVQDNEENVAAFRAMLDTLVFD